MTKQISRSKLLAKEKCRTRYQVGNTYNPVGALISEYLARPNLGIIQDDCFFDAPEDVMDLIMSISKCSDDGLRKYCLPTTGDFLVGWVAVMGSLLWDLESAGVIEVID